MPLFMDVHSLDDGVAVGDDATAHMADAAGTVHREARGLVADEIRQVREGS